MGVVILVLLVDIEGVAVLDCTDDGLLIRIGINVHPALAKLKRRAFEYARCKVRRNDYVRLKPSNGRL